MAGRKPIPDNLNKTGDVMDLLQGVKTKPLQEQPTQKEEESSFVPPAPPKEEETSLPTPATKINASDRVAAQPRTAPKPALKASEKIKVNLYLDEDIKTRTEQTQIDLRKIAPARVARQVNQSLIVETALKIVFDEFDRIGEASQLSQEIMKQLENK